MDGVFTLCRTTAGCTRLDRHDGACNVPVVMRRRGPASQLRYLAGQLDRSSDPGVRLAVAQALRDMARELE